MSLRMPLFQISLNAYLDPEKVRHSDARKQLEEPVRQWCGYELIRAYGVAITDIEFERPVRMGSRPHWIDILISREGKPVVVVECKKPSDQNLEKGIEQALSYADAPEIRAEFVVVTNGTDWQVKRRIQEKWCVVPDLPREFDRQGVEPLTELLRGFEALAPLLYKLDGTLAGEDARHFLDAMQRFFHGTNLLTDNIDPDLLCATDNLLRVMSLADEHPAYRCEKLASAVKHFEAYRSRKGLGIEFCLSQKTIPHEIQYLHAALLRTIETAQGLCGGEVFLLRLDTALTEYGMRQGRANDLYPQCSASMQQTFRDYLNYALLVHLNVALPEHLDDIWIGDMRGCCRSAWGRVVTENRTGFREFIGIWVAFLSSKLLFWKK